MNFNSLSKSGGVMMRCKSSFIGSLLVCAVIVGALTLIPVTAPADDSIKVTVSCPATITPGAMLNLGLTLFNHSSPPVSVTIAKSAVAAHLGNLDVIGPFVIPLARTLAPGETVTIPNYLTVPFPTAPRGTFSSLGVSVMNSANEPIGGSGCIIEIQ
jgi:hypothetical protein